MAVRIRAGIEIDRIHGELPDTDRATHHPADGDRE
jgi:hypothetical protein